VETCQPVIDAAGHALELRLPGPELVVEADLTRLSQVIANLLNNAAKYTPAGGRILLAAQADDGLARVTVEDNGLGIPPEMLPRVFDMFTQVDRNLDRSRGGLGLGLTIARRLAELHGGRLEAHSDGDGRGTRFVLELPALGRPAAPPPERGGAARPGAAPQPLRVLVADDNADSGDSLGHLLRLAGYATTVVRDGLQAFRVAEELRPDAVLLDLGMPGLSGFEVARRLRLHDWGRAMLLVAVTGWGQHADRLRSEAAGFDHHVVKPVDPQEIEALLAGAAARPRVAAA
jgi:CheY-like chemotaxis protein/anti-sigma regulatory factor (Ser/Thr protein kinase)